MISTNLFIIPPLKLLDLLTLIFGSHHRHPLRMNFTICAVHWKNVKEVAATRINIINKNRIKLLTKSIVDYDIKLETTGIRRLVIFMTVIWPNGEMS